MTTEDLMSLSQYAADRKRRGLPGATLQSVLNACNTGRIPYRTIGKNRFVDPTVADRSWILNTSAIRYSPDQLAALHAEPPPAPPPTATREAVRAEAWDLVFENAPVAAAVLVRELKIEPIAALQVASKAISTLLYCLAEATDNRTYLNGAVPAWATAALDGDRSSSSLVKALENVEHFAVELYRPEDEPPADELELPTMREITASIESMLA